MKKIEISVKKDRGFNIKDRGFKKYDMNKNMVWKI